MTLAEYAAAMPSEQKEIYYVCAKSADRARQLPQTCLLYTSIPARSLSM